MSVSDCNHSIEKIAAVDVLADGNCPLCAAAEIERLRERLGPRGLEVVLINDTGHYVNEKVKAEIERLRAPPPRGALIQAMMRARDSLGNCTAPQAAEACADAAIEYLRRTHEQKVGTD